MVEAIFQGGGQLIRAVSHAISRAKPREKFWLAVMREFKIAVHLFFQQIKGVGGKIYKELGAELETKIIDEDVPMGPAESFEQLLAEQPAWISNLNKFVTFAPYQRKYGKMDTTIDNVLRVHDKDGYLVAVSDRSVRHTHQMSFGWVLSTARGLHLAKS